MYTYRYNIVSAVLAHELREEHSKDAVKLVTFFIACRSGMHYILTFLIHKSALTIVKEMLSILALFDLSKTVQSDNGSEFTNNLNCFIFEYVKGAIFIEVYWTRAHGG
ncbi:hypothetical protein BD560DRAFT_417398 [Blakeslea trispora]|nr:hypothetical protein BD560DRAFT_417398 [Blakeslea trispora]